MPHSHASHHGHSRRRQNHSHASHHRKRRHGSSARRAVGSRAEVMHGTAHHTAGGLRRGDLKYVGERIVSRAASAAAKRRLAADPDLKAAFRENAAYMRRHGRAPTRASAAKP